MRLAAYPADLAAELEGGFTVTFADVPKAVTHGRDRDEALAEASAALASALSFHVDDGRPLPRPGAAAGRPLVRVGLRAAAKLAPRAALAQSGISQGGLARRLGCDPKAVRRLVDLGRRSHVDEVERALRALKRRVVIAGWSDAA